MLTHLGTSRVCICDESGTQDCFNHAQQMSLWLSCGLDLATLVIDSKSLLVC